MDASAVSLEMGATTEPHAILTTDMALVLETPAISDMYVTNVAGPTQGVPCRTAVGAVGTGKD